MKFRGTLGRSWRKAAGSGLVLLLMTVGLSACGDPGATATVLPAVGTVPAASSPAANPANLPVKAVVGALAPDFTVRTADGQSLQLSTLRGKAVIINFWSIY